MRRSRSAGDKFVFGSRRRTLTSSTRPDEDEEDSESLIGMKSPRPNKMKSPSRNPPLNKDRQYWQSNYHINDRKHHQNEFDQKEFDRFYKWIFENEKNTATAQKDVVTLMKLRMKLSSSFPSPNLLFQK